jgi:hypothetical protein
MLAEVNALDHMIEKATPSSRERSVKEDSLKEERLAALANSMKAGELLSRPQQSRRCHTFDDRAGGATLNWEVCTLD